MSTTHARFDGWEESWAKYLAHDSLAAPGLPGMTVSAIASTINARAAWVRLVLADPRAARIYPNAWAASAALDATYEPTVTKWDTYAPVGRVRTATNWNVTQVGGDWQIRNALDMVFPAPGAGTTVGCSIVGAIFCLRSWDPASDFHWPLLYCQLDTPVAIPIGGGPSPLFQADTFKFNVR
jgi:hypothetical protein